MRLISRVRFDALAAYCRDPRAAALAIELAWFEFADERVLATLLLDSDGEFSAVILARDAKERYRWVAGTRFFATPEEALVRLNRAVDELLPRLDRDRVQGDERGKAVDFFDPKRPVERLNPHFVTLSTNEVYSPARGIIEPMMRWYEDADGNFVEQFQTTGFDARLWELYIFAALTEAGYRLDRSLPVPDFVARGLRGEFCVEATTINPTVDVDGRPVPEPPLKTPQQQLLYAREYLPIRYAGPLTAKLRKRYWEHPHAANKPLVFAIQDFHESMSMVWSRSGLPIYLYGYDYDTRREPDGSLTIVPRKVKVHRWGEKMIESGFFSLPGSEHVSAVLFNSGGTLTKFNRMGVTGDFGSSNVVLLRHGTVFDPDPLASAPASFAHVVNREYTETWIEGMDVYHNPEATYPLDPEMLPGAAHHRLMSDGQVETTSPEWQPLASVTSGLIMDAGTAAGSEPRQ